MNKKVFFITNGLPGGGAERVMSIVANHLSITGYDVAFIMLRTVPEAYVLNENIKRYYKRKNKKGDIIGEILFIRKFMIKESKATFISFFTYQSFSTIIAAIGTKANVIVSERSYPTKSVHSKIGEIIRNILYGCKRCNSIIFQTEDVKKYFNEKISNKGVIILNPVKDNLPKYNGENRKKEIVAVGRLTCQKNYPLLLKAFANFNKKYSEYRLRIFGCGELDYELKELVNSLGIGNNVEFAGFESNIHKSILLASMFIISSDYEGISNALLEAMAIGLPCISTDSLSGGARMVIQDKVNGILVPVKDEKKLTEAMVEIAANPEWASKLGQNASKIRDDLSVEKICNQWKQVIDK